MKKSLLVLVALLFALPSFAQRNQGHPQSRPQMQRPSSPSRGGTQIREPRQHQEHVTSNRREYRGGYIARDRWDGRRFEGNYFRGHFGGEHRFYWHHSRWMGRPYCIGSRFYYGGAWFVLVNEVPIYWYDDEVYVDYIDGSYYLLNPSYPGVRIVIGVGF